MRRPALCLLLAAAAVSGSAAACHHDKSTGPAPMPALGRYAYTFTANGANAWNETHVETTVEITATTAAALRTITHSPGLVDGREEDQASEGANNYYVLLVEIPFPDGRGGIHALHFATVGGDATKLRCFDAEYAHETPGGSLAHTPATCSLTYLGE